MIEPSTEGSKGFQTLETAKKNESKTQALRFSFSNVWNPHNPEFRIGFISA
jgi:hypothetical protein